MLFVYLAILGINSTGLNVDSIATINAKAEVVTLNGWQFYKNLQVQKFACYWFVKTVTYTSSNVRLFLKRILGVTFYFFNLNLQL